MDLVLIQEDTLETSMRGRLSGFRFPSENDLLEPVTPQRGIPSFAVKRREYTPPADERICVPWTQTTRAHTRAPIKAFLNEHGAHAENTIRRRRSSRPKL